MDDLVFYHSPRSRSGATLLLLEELGIPYELRLLDIRKGESRDRAYLSVNPMGKVPAIVHRGALVTEQVAIFLYLADLVSEARLAPPLADPLRGPYLRWMVFYNSCFEPAVSDRALKREPGPQSMLGYGNFETMMATLEGQLARGPWILGERFSAADILWGTALDWTTSFGLVDRTSPIDAYVARLQDRPAIRRARERDDALAAAVGA